MRIVANFFLIAFLIDASLSVVDEFLSIYFEVDGLTLVRAYFAYFVLLFSIPIYISLGIHARLPKRIFIPLIVFIYWVTFYPYPMSLFMEGRVLTFTLSATQLFLGITSILYIRFSNKGSWLLTKESVAGPIFSGKNTAIFLACNAALIPVLVVLVLYAVLSYSIVQMSAGFIRMDLDGIHMAEKVYHKEDQNIRLVSMVHIGEQSYYDELNDSFISSETIVLTEGVTDRDGLIESFPSYTKLASLLGLSSQSDMQLEGNQIEHDYVGEDSFNDEYDETLPDVPTFVRADIDTRDLSDETISFLNNLGEKMNSGDSIVDGIVNYFSWANANMTPEVEERIWTELVNKRNDKVLAYLDEALFDYNQVVIPWGAMHMPGIERAVLAKGFTQGRIKEHLAIEFDFF